MKILKKISDWFFQIEEKRRLKKQWMEALRSGEYKESSLVFLRTLDDRYSFTGVLCDVLKMHWFEDLDRYSVYNNQRYSDLTVSCVLPIYAEKKLGIKNKEFYKLQTNVKEKSFAQIADILEKDHERYFNWD